MKKIIAVVLAGLAVTASAVWYAGDTTEPRLDPALAATLATQVRDPIETSISADWGLGTSTARRMACAVLPVGTEPASARTAAEVTSVYGWADCATRDATRSGTLVPVAVHLTPAARVEYPSDADWDTGSVRRMFPERLHAVLVEADRSTETTAALEAALDARIEQLG